MARLEVDAVVLVDGGADLLMFGDAPGLGTPAEDMTSLAAVTGLDGLDAVAVCMGFGIDAFHGRPDRRGGQGRLRQRPAHARTGQTELFVNPLMSIYFAVDLAGLVARSLYLPLLEGTQSLGEVARVIEGFREELPRARLRRTFPH